jgi:hypothetical protein
MEPEGRGHHQLMLRFDPSDHEQTRFAIQTVKAYRKRSVVVTPEILAWLKAAREARTVPFLERNLYQEGGLDNPSPVTLGIGTPWRGNSRLR